MFIDVLSGVRFSADRPMTQLLYDHADCRVVVFGFRAGQSLPPHDSPSTVLVQVLTGRGRFGVANQEQVLEPGHIGVCPPNVPHFLSAETDMTVLAVISPRP